MFKNCVFKVSVDTRKWVKAAGVRAIRTTAQTALALIPAGVTIGAVDWKVVLSTSILAGGILTSTKLSNYRIEQLEKKVEKHNSVIERTAILERDLKSVWRNIDEIKDDIREEVNHE